MKRRKFVTASGATLLAGCNEIQESNPEDPPPSETVPTQEGPNQSSEEASNEDLPIGDIVIQETDWAVEGNVSQFLLSNVGEAPAGPITLVTQWFDSNGDYVGYDQVSIPVLNVEHTWFVHVESSAPFDVDRFDGFVEFKPRYETDDLAVKSVEIDQSIPAITGVVSHDRDEKTAIHAAAVTYNSGWATHAGQLVDRHIPGGTDWRFLIPLTQVGAEESSVGDSVETMFTLL